MNQVKIGSLEIKGKTALAPLAGVTDIPFRLACKKFGAPVVFSEMVSSEGLIRGSERTNRYLDFKEEERPIAIQIFGGDPEVMGEAARIVEQNWKPDLIDINFGCPVKKVVRNEAGSALLKDPAKMGAIVNAMACAVKTPITAKIRCGWDESSAPVSEIGKILEDSGAAAIALHARTRAQQFTGAARWDQIALLKEAVNIPVIGNGDVKSALDAQRMIAETGCDMVMIGRGAMGYPWIFRELQSFFETGVIPPKPNFDERIRVCLDQFDVALELYGSRYASTNLKKQIGWYLKGLPECGRIKRIVFNAQEHTVIKDTLEEYYVFLAEKFAGMNTLSNNAVA